MILFKNTSPLDHCNTVFMFPGQVSAIISKIIYNNIKHESAPFGVDVIRIVGIFKIVFFFLEYFTKSFSVSCVLVRTNYDVCQTYIHTYTSETSGKLLRF